MRQHHTHLLAGVSVIRLNGYESEAAQQTMHSLLLIELSLGQLVFGSLMNCGHSLYDHSGNGIVGPCHRVANQG